jgi:hypothetical protein
VCLAGSACRRRGKEVVAIPAKREAKGKRQEISEEIRRWADNVMVPALVREYLAERDQDKELYLLLTVTVFNSRQ